MIARNMTLSVLGGSLAMFAAAVGCGEHTSTPSPSPATTPPSAETDQKPGGELDLVLDAPEPAPAPEPVTEEVIEDPAPAGPALFEVDGVSLRRLVVSTGIVGREPVGEATSFEGGQPIYAFMEARNDTDEDAALYLTFEGPGGRSVGHVTLDVPARSPRWRTWGYSRVVDEPGDWEAVVTTLDGQELGRMPFEIAQ